MVETCMNVLSSIPLYSFIKVDFITKLPSGTSDIPCSFSTTKTILLSRSVPADLS